MATSQDSSSTQDSSSAVPSALPDLPDERVSELARQHLTELTSRQRTPPAAMPVAAVPRLRRFGRHAWDIGSKLLDLVEIAGRFLVNPRHVPGRWLARMRLLAPAKTFNVWLLGMVAFTIVLGLATFLPLRRLPEFMQTQPNWRKGAVVAVMGSLFTGTVLGLLTLLWSDLVRSPHHMRRICRQIRQRPDCVLLNNIAPRAVKLTVREEPVKIVPRTELYDEVTPGVLHRKRKDVQIVVGDPGAGKTTALIGIAGILASLGIVPVLVPVRSDDHVQLLELGRQRLKQQVHDYFRSDSQFDELWRWLYQRRRVAILTDDLDRLSPDGERGYILRTALEEIETTDLPIIVTARPAGVPAGIAASAIGLGALDEQRAVDCVSKGARNDPSFRAAQEVSPQSLARWIAAGELTDVPYYLELLAQLAAAGADTFPELGEPWTSTIELDQKGLFKPEPDGSARWNPWWVHFQLLDHYYREVCSGSVARWKGIEPRERRGAMEALQRSALGVLLAQAVSARAQAEPRAEREAKEPERSTVEDFVPTDDRNPREGERALGFSDFADPAVSRRPGISAHEVIDTAERLRILDRDATGLPQFRHRITQAYLAGRRLAAIEAARHAEPTESDDWIDLLLDHRHPEKLTAHTALTFAALWADREYRNARLRAERAGHEAGNGSYANAKEDGANGPSVEQWRLVALRILDRLVQGAQSSLHAKPRVRDNPDPMQARDPEERRDSDDALIKLTTAADVAQAIAAEQRPRRHAPANRRLTTQLDILNGVEETDFVTRWTKLNAIKAIGGLDAPERWHRIWDFAVDPDYAVRQAATAALEHDACIAYRALEPHIEKLITRAAALSALHQSIEKPTATGRPEPPPDRDYYIGEWWSWDVLRLRALGTVLPAVVSGLQEDPAAARALASWQGRDVDARDGSGPAGSEDGSDVSPEVRLLHARHARDALDHLVALSFQGDHHMLERAVAQGFRGDAMRHAAGETGSGGPANRSHAGPGWIAAHQRLVVTVALSNAEHWYAQLMLGQAVALYTIAGGNRDVGYAALARCLQRGGLNNHPFTQRALRLARTAVRRESVRSARWRAFLWDDETSGSNKRAVQLTSRTAQLLGDVTVLLDLSESAQEDRQEASAHMNELPYCLHRSRDRREILGTGCPPECGWNLCPYKQPPPEEPNEHHGVSRSFCRQQRWIARHHRPPWQRRIRRRRLSEYWSGMERRARL